nr:TatD family hydrolase [Gemmatimonadaceae bacterium]
YKNNDVLRAVVKLTPLDRLLVETDAPYLAPEPVRKFKTNEPAFVMHTARVVAEMKGTSIEEIDRITTRNVLNFFRWA